MKVWLQWFAISSTMKLFRWRGLQKKIKKPLTSCLDLRNWSKEQHFDLPVFQTSIIQSFSLQALPSIKTDDKEKAKQNRFTVDKTQRFSRPRRRRARKSCSVQIEVDSVETKTRSLSGKLITGQDREEYTCNEAHEVTKIKHRRYNPP